jgi:hypothetical protein
LVVSASRACEERATSTCSFPTRNPACVPSFYLVNLRGPKILLCWWERRTFGQKSISIQLSESPPPYRYCPPHHPIYTVVLFDRGAICNRALLFYSRTYIRCNEVTPEACRSYLELSGTSRNALCQTGGLSSRSTVNIGAHAHTGQHNTCPPTSPYPKGISSNNFQARGYYKFTNIRYVCHRSTTGVAEDPKPSPTTLNSPATGRVSAHRL